MLKTPKKQSEIMIVGSGVLAGAVASYLARKGRKITRIEDSSTVHFLGDRLASNGSEKVGFKQALVILPNLTDAPTIKGLATTNYEMLPLHRQVSKNLRYVIAGNGPLVVDAALTISRAGSRVDIVHKDTLLSDYDVSVQDAVRRHLKSLRINDIVSYSILASTTKGSKTSLLLKSKTDSEQLSCDRLLLEPIKRLSPDMGLTNLKLSVASKSREIKSNVLIIDQDEVFDLTDIKRLADIIDRNRGKLRERVHQAHCTIQDSQLFSFGLLEQEVNGTHHAYQRSVARSNDSTESFHGFIKVLTNKQGNILSVSGILPASYANISLLHYAVKNRLTVESLLELLDIGDELTDELMEVAREIR